MIRPQQRTLKGAGVSRLLWTECATCSCGVGATRPRLSWETGRDVLIGAVSHRGADCAPVVDLPLNWAQIEAGLSVSWRRALPGWQPTDETLNGMRPLLDLAAAYPWGATLQAVDGCARLTQPITITISHIARLLLVTLAMLGVLTPAAALVADAA